MVVENLICSFGLSVVLWYTEYQCLEKVPLGGKVVKWFQHQVFKVAYYHSVEFSNKLNEHELLSQLKAHVVGKMFSLLQWRVQVPW